MGVSVSDPAKESVRILLVDAERFVRAGLRMLVDSWPGMCVVGEAGISPDTQRIASKEGPDVILLDVDWGGMDLLPQLTSVSENCRVIAMTQATDSEVTCRAMRLGAKGVVLKERGPEELRSVIRTVHHGEVWIDSKLTAHVIKGIGHAESAKKSDLLRARMDSLTKREREIVGLVGEGLKNKLIAKRLFISEVTVRHHMTSIFSKLGVSDRFELIIYLFQCKASKATA